MPGWSQLPRNRLLADVSLWSADLGNLEAAARRLSPWTDSFHLDAADGHFVPSLLFFPDLIRAIRPHTTVPFHVHLMAEHPSQLASEFLDAGADLLTVHVENGEREAGAAIEKALRHGCGAGVALKLETPVRAMLPYLDAVVPGSLVFQSADLEPTFRWLRGHSPTVT